MDDGFRSRSRNRQWPPQPPFVTRFRTSRRQVKRRAPTVRRLLAAHLIRIGDVDGGRRGPTLAQGAFLGLRTVTSCRSDSRMIFSVRAAVAPAIRPLAKASRLDIDAGLKTGDFACLSCSLAAIPHRPVRSWQGGCPWRPRLARRPRPCGSHHNRLSHDAKIHQLSVLTWEAGQ